MSRYNIYEDLGSRSDYQRYLRANDAGGVWDDKPFLSFNQSLAVGWSLPKSKGEYSLAFAIPEEFLS